MSRKKYAAIPMAAALCSSYVVPAFAATSNPVENVFETQITSVETTIENVSDVIQTSLNSIEIEKPEPINEVIYQPEVTYVVEYVSEPVMTAYQIPVEWITTSEEETVDSSAASEAQAAYDAALAAYNQALADYEAANQPIETTKEVEVEVVEEVEDEDGNITTEIRTETQTVTETSYAGDVEAAQASLDAAAAELDAASANLESAQTPQPVIEENPATEVIVEESDSTKEAADVTPTSGTFGDVKWTLNENGELNISKNASANVIEIKAGGNWNKDDVKTIVIEEGVTAIAAEAFKDYSNLIGVILPKESLTTIGDSAFERCTKLASIQTWVNLTTIGNRAFAQCSSLTSVEISSNIKTLGTSAFESCENLTTVKLPDSLLTIGEFAFHNCRLLASIAIPNTVTTMGKNTFSECVSLTYVTLPEQLTTIAKNAFYGCTNLVRVDISNKVTTIESSAFQGCKSLSEITLPEVLTTIGEYAFYGCEGLTKMAIPDTVTTIGRRAFSGCKGLTEMVIPDSVTELGREAFYNCEGLTSITLSDRIETLQNGTFDGCKNLNSITIPDSVKTIGDYAFYGCTGLSKVNLGGATTTIGNNAFQDTTSLEFIYLSEWLETIGDYAFDGSGLKTIYCAFSKDEWDSNVKKGTLPYADSVKIYYLDEDGFFDYCLTSLSLDGNIGVNFYFDFGSAVLDDKDAKVELSIGDNTISFLAKDGRKMTARKRTFYGFTREVTSLQMAENITSKVVLSNGYTIDGRTTGVRDYCKNKLESSDTNEKLKQLLHDLLNFGGYAQTSFKYKTDDLANKDLSDKDVSDVTAETLVDYESVKLGDQDGIHPLGSTLTLDSSTSIKHYFLVTDGHNVNEFKFMLGGKEVTPIHSGNVYYVEIPNITSTELDTAFTLTVGDWNYTYSALSYAYAQLNKTSTSERIIALQNVCRALYKYNQSADRYFG